MPTTSRTFVKASIIYLSMGALLGALLFINRWMPLAAGVPVLKSSHIVMLVAGWLTQLIMGVGWWLFPPLDVGIRSDAPKPMRRGQAQRGSEPLFWATFVCLNAGILLRALFDPLYTWTQIDAFAILSAMSGPLLLIAACAFVVNMWRRVRALRD
jgi:hypothetical protein